MTLKITTEMLDQLGGAAHTVDGCARVRSLLASAGVDEAPMLNIYETTEVCRLQNEIAKLTAKATEIEQRGPWPPHIRHWTDPS